MTSTVVHSIQSGSTNQRSIVIVRHAIAIASGYGTDFERALTSRGREDAQRMARHLSGLGLNTGLLLHSTARRAAETAHAFIDALSLPASSIQPEPRLYQADVNDALDLLRDTDDAITTVIIVGHNPMVSSLAFVLAGEEVHLSPGSVAIVQHPSASWLRLAPDERGTLLFSASPATLIR